MEINFLAGSPLVKASKVLGGNYVLLLTKFIIDAREECLGERNGVLILTHVQQRSQKGLGGKERDGIGDATMVFCCSEAKPPPVKPES